MLKCKHRGHCACSSEIGICIINDAGRQTAHTKKPAKIHFYNHVLKLNIIFHRKENFIFFLTKLNDIIPLISNTLVIVDGAQGSTQRPAKPAPGD
jgi:hypothetical protein